MSFILNPYRYAAGGGGGGSPTYIGGDFLVTQSGTTATLNVPGSATTGDLVVVILRCRGDRTFSGFTGWTIVRNSTIQTTQPADSTSTIAYVLTRTLASESSFSFTHSASAAFGAALLVFRDGAVVTEALTNGQSATITKAGANSLLLAVALANSHATTPGDPVFTSYTRRGRTYFDSAGTFFYEAICETRSGVGAGSTTASGTFSSAGNQDAVWLAEIG